MKELKTDIICLKNGKLFEGTREAFQKKFTKGKTMTNDQIMEWCEKKRVALEINGLCFSNP
jgi:hypothetical protein